MVNPGRGTRKGNYKMQNEKRRMPKAHCDTVEYRALDDLAFTGCGHCTFSYGGMRRFDAL
jgi:hypothetical protein